MGDLVTPTHAAASFKKRHGFGVLMEVDLIGPGQVVYVVKFTKSREVIRFTKDAIEHYE